MLTFFWTFLVFGVLGSAVLVGLCLLSGITILQRIAQQICCLKIELGEKDTVLRLRFPLICLTIAVASFMSENVALNRLDTQRTLAIQAGASISDVVRASILRHQRNWWISLTAATTWGVVWRLSGLVARMRKELDDLRRIPTPVKK